MDYVKCLDDDKIYTAFEFAGLPVEELSRKRRNLVCKECGNQAYFKKASKSGQVACFGARPHKDNCSLKSIEADTIFGSLSESEALIAQSDLIKIDFNFGASNKINIKQNDENLDIVNKIGKKYDYKYGEKQRYCSRRLSSILKLLINTEFVDLDTKIEINDYTYKAKNLFVNFKNVSKNIGKFSGLYGQILSARFDKDGSLWLNFGVDIKECAIVIKASILPNFWTNFNLQNGEEDELIGKYVLCLGFINRSSGDKLYLSLKDIGYITVL